MTENTLVSTPQTITQSEMVPQGNEIVGSVDPIGIAPDSPVMPGDQPFSLPLDTAPALFNTVDANIQTAGGSSAPANGVSVEGNS